MSLNKKKKRKIGEPSKKVFVVEQASNVKDLQAINAILPLQFPLRFYKHALKSEQTMIARRQSDKRVIGAIIAEQVDDVVHVKSLAVDVDARRLGVASELVERVSGDAEQAKTLVVEVVEGNDDAIAFYEARGFVLRETKRNYYSQRAAKVLRSRTCLVFAKTLDVE